ncbi:MAG: VIT1/CCC1 transporter family protein [Candidatus Rokubacteria bacterium]|nr:VIT1/CCC1 transporter family protein [Candidatus Rokubacteria bacterium]
MAGRRQDTGKLARTLVLDELFDLSLYEMLRNSTRGDLRRMLEELIPIETKHFAFWQEFFGTQIETLDWRRRLKLRLLGFACRLFGDRAIHLVLEAIEIYGVRKYLVVWETYKHDPLGHAVKDVLEDELRHEDRVVSAAIERRIDPAAVRNLFLGFNDGLVEIMGAVSGLYAAFQDAPSILMASSTVAVAGSLSMAAGAFVASSSESEIQRLEADKRVFLGEPGLPMGTAVRPLRAAWLIGGSYLLGAMIPVLPVLLGTRTIAVSLITGGAATVCASAVLAFLSGMEIKRRLLMNAAILAAAVGITYAIGLAARSVFGISVS